MYIPLGLLDKVERGVLRFILLNNGCLLLVKTGIRESSCPKQSKFVEISLTCIGGC